jgi:hypothetical protein
MNLTGKVSRGHSRLPKTHNAPVEFGATGAQFLWDAYQGTGAYAREKPRTNLRLIANIQSPTYLIVTVRSDLGIRDLGQIRQKRWPVRVPTSVGSQAMASLLAEKHTPCARGHLEFAAVDAIRPQASVLITAFGWAA